MTKKNWRVLGWIVLGGVIVVAFFAKSASLHFKQFDLAAFQASLLPLLVIALLIERAVQVFFGPLLEPDNVRFRAALRRAEAQRIAVVETGTMGLAVSSKAAAKTGGALPNPLEVLQSDRWQTANDAVATAMDNRANRKAANTQIAWILSVILSFGIALVGARVVSPLIDPAPVGTPTGFDFVDVVLTTALLAGGADGFHHIMAVLSTGLKGAQEALDRMSGPRVTLTF